MNFKQAAKLGSYISKDYAEDVFRLLANYSSISASEAASRLNLHIKTVQDFLEAMFDLGILSREEVYEKKRPYYRYTILTKRVSMELDLEYLFPGEGKNELSAIFIRERNGAGVRFTTARSGHYISSISILLGKGRDRTERKINLSNPQGMFLFHLPFPTADYQSVASIMKKADISSSHNAEILDIVNLLQEFDVIERVNNPVTGDII